NVYVRLVAASCRNLEEMVQENEFREDLYYRINVLPLNIPPLRERKEDLPLLLDHFVTLGAIRLGRKRPTMTADFIETLHNYFWPGNIRELENLIDRCLVMAVNQDQLSKEDLPLQLAQNTKAKTISPQNLNLKTATKELETAYIAAALEESCGNRSEAARLLAISYPSLLSKIKAYGLS
ncbi:MAG: helix-turn-helix domain-containing protein, partial [Candidatus Adiutrix sp.]